MGEQPTLWESILPVPLLGMPAELAAVDRLLDDSRFVEPYRGFFHPVLGRRSIPIETYLRLNELSCAVVRRGGLWSPD